MFSRDGTLISASAAPHCGVFWENNGAQQSCLELVVGHKQPSEAIQGMLYRVQTWRTHRPVFSYDVDPSVGCDDSGTIARGVVVYKDEVLDRVSLLKVS